MYLHSPQANVITQLRMKVRDSTVRNNKLTQLVTELKNEGRDVKHHAEESDAAHAKLVADLKVSIVSWRKICNIALHSTILYPSCSPNHC